MVTLPPAGSGIRERKSIMEQIANKYDEVISLDVDIYPLESIHLAACAFLDEAFIYLYREKGGGGSLQTINVALKARDNYNIDEISGRFSNELNRQSLRMSLDKMNRKVRTQIVGRALASALYSRDKPAEGGA